MGDKMFITVVRPPGNILENFRKWLHKAWKGTYVMFGAF